MLEETLDFIARHIQTLRETKGSSARDMSISLGQNIAYINKIENKQARPSIEGLIFICDYFGISLSEFFDKGIEFPMQTKILLEEAKKLDAHSLDLLIALAQKINHK